MAHRDPKSRAGFLWRASGGTALALAAASAGAWWAWRGDSREKAGAAAVAVPERPMVPTVKVVRPRPGGIERTVQQPATIQAFESVDLYAMVSGYLKSQTVDIGSPIKKGQVLAEIAVPRDEEMVAEAESLVEQAKARTLLAGAQIEVAEARGAAAEAMARQSASDVDRLVAALDLARKQFVRVKHLADSHAVDRRLVDEHQRSVDTAVAAERTARIAVQTARAQAQAARAEVDKARAEAGAATAALKVVEAGLARLKVNLKYAKITAPFDGVVTRRTFHPGALIHSAATSSPALPLLTVKRTDLMRVVVLVPDRDVVLTRPGIPVKVSVDALGGKMFQGVLARVAHSEDEQRLMRVEVDLPNPENRLSDGMYGKAEIALKPDAASLVLPAACVVEHSGRNGGAVYVVRNGAVERREVVLGGDNGTLVEVRKGIGPNDLVVRPSGVALEAGMRVASTN